MKYALCLRGINYIENYTHDNKRGITPYTIDFKENIPYLYKFIILPLEKAGHTVDIFFVTYESEKLQEFVNLLEPKKVKINTFEPRITSYNWRNIFQLIRDSLSLVMEYSKEKSINYDYTITLMDYYHFFGDNIGKNCSFTLLVGFPSLSPIFGPNTFN